MDASLAPGSVRDSASREWKESYRGGHQMSCSFTQVHAPTCVRIPHILYNRWLKQIMCLSSQDVSLSLVILLALSQLLPRPQVASPCPLSCGLPWASAMWADCICSGIFDTSLALARHLPRVPSKHAGTSLRSLLRILPSHPLQHLALVCLFQALYTPYSC